MKDLSLAKASELADLASKKYEEYCRTNKPGISGGQDLVDSMLGEFKSEEAKAYRNAVLALSVPEARDAVALMYVGRGDHLDDELSTDSAREAFLHHHQMSSMDSFDQLTDVLLDKGLRMHRYLKDGTERVRQAFF
ncbi:hypothetical protein ACI2KC_17970 [Pseudomonas monteilii]|uniref:hypothetical protein n=1 Tax=Pseudomonas alabamensis TaxID=3064349 RepID=UPI003853B022